VVSLDGSFALFPLTDIYLPALSDAHVSWTGQNGVQVTLQGNMLLAVDVTNAMKAP
jgi:hypothetical protein